MVTLKQKTIHLSNPPLSLGFVLRPAFCLHPFPLTSWTVLGSSHLRVLLQEVAVRNTPLFLRYLTDQMHERVPGSLVLWYDSVTENGQLQWQNELNPSNR